MKMSVTPALTIEYKKILQAKFTLGQEDEFYEITKNAKNKFEYKLKEDIWLVLRTIKRKIKRIAFVLRINCPWIL
jgi:hypothetical protein